MAIADESRAFRVLIASTPVGPLGSGVGGGVELTLHNLVFGLTAMGHSVEVIAPAGSLHVGERMHQIDGTLQPSTQLVDRGSPVTVPTNSVLAAMWAHVRDVQGDFDVVINLAYDWLPLYLTDFFDVPVAHLLSMVSLNDAMDQVIAQVAKHSPGRLAVHSKAQAETFDDPASFRVLGNGIVTERYDFRSVAGPHNALGWIGRISPEKGLEDVVALSARTGRLVKVWGLLQDEAYLDRVIGDHPGAQIDYRGFLPTDELQAELGHCAAVIMTPKWVEAFGNVAIEALATGVPVITYDRGGPAEIVVDGVTGFVTPPDDIDALRSAVERIDRIDRWQCRVRVDTEYSSTAMAERTMKWVEDVIAQHAASSPPSRVGRH